MSIACLLLEVALYGTALLWLLLLVPAAVVTVYKGRWLYFWCGWLTLGATWIIGALALASPGSGRARRRISLAWAASALLAIVALGLVGARPAALLGLSGRALQNSVGGRAIEPCHRLDERTWNCRH